MIQAYFKGKLVIQENRVKQNEDFKTSSSVGLLQYLPDDVFWNIMQNCCVGLNVEDFGKTLSFNYWEHTDPKGTTNEYFVEPDVWIETSKYDILIEAKVSDGIGQYGQQWKNEIQSILNEQSNKGYQKKIILFALGGNESMHKETTLGYPVYKVSWYNLMNAVVNERERQKEEGALCRILDDVIELFAHQGIMRIQWLKTLPMFFVDDKALSLWKVCKHKTRLGFSTISTMSINENINEINILKWNPIDQQKNN